MNDFFKKINNDKIKRLLFSSKNVKDPYIFFIKQQPQSVFSCCCFISTTYNTKTKRSKYQIKQQVNKVVSYKVFKKK